METRLWRFLVFISLILPSISQRVLGREQNIEPRTNGLTSQQRQGAIQGLMTILRSLPRPVVQRMFNELQTDESTSTSRMNIQDNDARARDGRRVSRTNNNSQLPTRRRFGNLGQARNETRISENRLNRQRNRSSIRSRNNERTAEQTFGSRGVAISRVRSEERARVREQSRQLMRSRASGVARGLGRDRESNVTREQDRTGNGRGTRNRNRDNVTPPEGERTGNIERTRGRGRARGVGISRGRDMTRNIRRTRGQSRTSVIDRTRDLGRTSNLRQSPDTLRNSEIPEITTRSSTFNRSSRAFNGLRLRRQRMETSQRIPSESQRIQCDVMVSTQ
ncbi:serine/threonine-protein kinase fray2-like [Ylistrum balloti]|uniref:serine/threonine-protein kinase fray2-like n=1 Tax=Ylistrum balloti TaxID=509963 RepID=UPI002905A5BB|nr:serine/threonine-protein kinase fray2-like [Ylistrum balloti]